MKKSRSVMMSLLLAASLAVPAGASAAPDQQSNNAEKFRVYVEVSGESAQKTKASLQKKYDSRWELGANGFSTDMNEAQFKALQNNKNLKLTKVDEVSVDTLRSNKNVTTAFAAPADQTPWGIEAIYNDANVSATSGGSGINVAVLDTGVFTGHHDLQGTVEQCKDFTQATPLVNGSCNDVDGHGTHVAGSVLADGGSDGSGVYGVAPDADLWAYKVLGDDGSGYSDDIAAAIRHTADQAVATGSNTVINMSLGSSANSPLIEDAVNYAYDKGVLVVAAAGNSGFRVGSIGYPGALENAIAVAALENRFENGTYRVADFSSRGVRKGDGDYLIQEGDVEISAPGAAVFSTWPNGGYNTISGTSMASPHVAGLAAKVWAENPGFSHVQLRTELQNRAKANDILGGRSAAVGDDLASGFGFAKVN